MPPSGWCPQVQTCSAMENIDIDKIWKMIVDYQNFTEKNGYFVKKRSEQSKYWLYETIDEAIKNYFYKNPKIKNLLAEYEQKLNKDEISPFIAAHKLLETYNL